MAKQLNVNLAVTADTGQAKVQLQQLQTTLSQLSTSSTNLHLGLNTSELNKAISDVDKLSAHLKNATNSSGLLDFGKLNTSIKQSGSSLTAYGNQLLKLGPQGQQAFNQLTQAIAKSEIPMSRMKGLLGEFGTVLGNTIKWQAASSAIHGMMGSIQYAFSYAQQLNKSLNNIQIVTGLSNDKMAQFAESANKAAKRLSTTTTDYTDAALIYYQQGIRDDQEIAKRVETTIKLANVSGQSAEKVSDQMTAIWNNFAKGGDNLERYADVITALGAATASSSEEIATGLSKFAAIADTVGLSYDNATAALATITATTRQSADTVGTGLRTLFARLQSLNLGETLDDGVTLTKYTKALEKIGISVIDAAGNMRSMDDILDDMGQKWQTLTDAQKTATAQTVGGVRQYTTLMALMENYDFYRQNQKVAANAEGTVQAQADIYAKSWEAAQKRVKASAESIYSDLINDDFFIGLNNGFATFLDILDQIIDGFGGLKTLLPMIGAALTNLFSSQISAGMVNFANSLAMFKPGYAKAQASARDNFLTNAATSMLGIQQGRTMTSAQQQQLAYAKADLNIQQRYAQNAPIMSAFDRQLAQIAMDKFSNLRNSYMQNANQIEISRSNQREARTNMIGVNSSGLNIYTRQNQMDRVAQQQYNSALQFARLAHAGGQNAPQYFTDNANNVGLWFAANGQFLKSVYDQAFQQSGDLGTLTKGINSRQDEIAILQNLKATGYQGLGTAIKSFKALSGGQRGTRDILDDLISRGIIDTNSKSVNTAALDDQIDIITEEQDKMVTDFAAKWGKSKESVMKYKDAIVATNGDLKKQEELKQQMDQAEEQAIQATKKNAQIERSQKIVKYAQAMQGAVATGNSFAAVTQNIATNLENGGSIFDNFGQTLSGITSGFMSASMVIAAIPGPAGIAIAAISALIGVLSQIPAVTDFFHKLFTSDDQLALEQAQKNAELIQNEFEEAKRKADEFLSATGTHNQLLEEINKCTQGTAAFKQAVIEANAYAKQMMQDYNLTLNDFTRNVKTGALELNADAVENRQRTLEANRDNLEIMAAYSQYEVKRAQFQRANNSLNEILNSKANGMTDTGGSYYGGGWAYASTPTVQELINDYIESGVTSTFEEYAQSRGYDKFGSGQTTVYGKMKKQLQELGYVSIDEFIQAQQDYGDASSIKFDGIVSDLFRNIATSKVFNEDRDLELSSFLSSYLGTSENGDLIRDASLSNWISGNNEIQQSVLDALLNSDQHLDFTNLDADQLWTKAEYLREFLVQVGSFDAAAVREMSLIDLQTNAQSLLSAQEGIQIFDNNYKILANDPGIKMLGEIGKKGQREQQIDRGSVQRIIDAYKARQEAGETLTEEEQLLFSYYSQWAENFDQAKTTMIENAAKLFFEDQKYQDNITEQETLKRDLQEIISNSSLTDAEIAETLNLGSQIKNVLGEAFSPDQFKGLFTNSDLTDIYKSIDWSSPLSALFDVASIKQRIGNAGTEISDIINNLYDTLLDSDHLNGQVGIFDQIFQEEDFQKGLKKVQREIKKTGKVSQKSLDDIISSCDDLSEALELGVIDSAGAVADAIELYSMGAIDSIDSISNELFNALSKANELRDALREAFKFIDNFNPDRSISDLGKFFNETSEDYFSELAAGNTGGERMYQEAEVLFNKYYADYLRRFFYEQETGEETQDNPELRSKNYTETFEAFDRMWQEVQESGDLSPFWRFMLDENNQEAIEKIMGQSDVKSKLEALGFSIGENEEDIEFNTQGQTTNDVIRGLMNTLGISEEQAQIYLSEIAGHSAGIATDLQTNDFLAGAVLAGPENIGNYINARKNDLSWETMAASVSRQYGVSILDENGQIDANGFVQAMNERAKTAAETVANLQEQYGIEGELDAAAIRQAVQEGKITDEQAEQIAAALQLQQLTAEQAENAETYAQALQAAREEQERIARIKADLTRADTEIVYKHDGTIDRDNSNISDETADAMDTAFKNAKILENGIDFDSLLSSYQALGMTSEDAYQRATQAAESSGRTLTSLYTDINGQTHEFIADNAHTLEEYQQQFQTWKTDVDSEAQSLANRQFGRDIFAGILDAFQELQDTDLTETTTEFITALGNLAQAMAQFDGTDAQAAALGTMIENLLKLGGIDDIPEDFGNKVSDVIKAIQNYNGDEATSNALNAALAALGSLGGITIPDGLGDALGPVITAIKQYDGSPASALALSLAINSLLGLNSVELASNLGSTISQILTAFNNYSGDGDFSGLDEAFKSFQELTGIQIPAFLGAQIGSILNALKNNPDHAGDVSTAIGDLAKAFNSFNGSPESYTTLISSLQTNLPILMGALSDLPTEDYPGAAILQAAIATIAAALGVEMPDGTTVAAGVTAAAGNISTAADGAADTINQKASLVEQAQARLKKALGVSTYTDANGTSVEVATEGGLLPQIMAGLDSADANTWLTRHHAYDNGRDLTSRFFQSRIIDENGETKYIPLDDIILEGHQSNIDGNYDLLTQGDWQSFINLFNTPYNGTEFSVGSVAMGTPLPVRNASDYFMDEQTGKLNVRLEDGSTVEIGSESAKSIGQAVEEAEDNNTSQSENGKSNGGSGNRGKPSVAVPSASEENPSDNFTQTDLIDAMNAFSFAQDQSATEFMDTIGPSLATVLTELYRNNSEWITSTNADETGGNPTQFTVGDTTVDLTGYVTVEETNTEEVEPVELQGTINADTGINEETNTITVELNDDMAQEQLDELSVGQEVTVAVDDNGTITYVQGKIDGITGKSVSITISDHNKITELLTKLQSMSSTTWNVNLSVNNRGAGVASGGYVYSYANGSANRHVNPGVALTGEEGPEIIWNKGLGYAYIVGQNHPQFANLQPGDRIFNANDTRKILNYNQPNGNWQSSILDPSMLRDSLFGSFAEGGSAYGTYGPNGKLGKSEGSSGGPANKKTKDFTPERYHVITRQIQDLTFWYEELQKARENAYGTNVLSAIQDEIDATNELYAAQKLLVEEAAHYLEQDRKALVDLLGDEVEFDEKGNIRNWDTLQDKYWEAAQNDNERAQKIKAAAEQYEETIDKWQDSYSELTDLMYQLAELQLEKITVKAEMELDFDDKEIKLLDHYLKNIDDDIYMTADALSIMGNKLTLLNRKLASLDTEFKDIVNNLVDKEGKPIVNPNTGKPFQSIDEFLSLGYEDINNLNINGKFGEELEKIADGYLEAIEAMEDLKTNGVEKVNAAFEQLTENVDKQLELFDHYSQMLETIKNISGLMNTGINKDFRNILTQLNQATINNGKNNLIATKQYLDELMNQREDYLRRIATEGDSALRKALQDGLDTVNDKINETQENLLSTWEQTLQQAKDIFDATLDQLVSDYEASMGGTFGSSNLLSTFFDKQKEINDLYLDQINKYLGLNKLARSIDKYIGEFNQINKNIQGTTRLRNLNQEILQLQKNGQQISEYDLGVLERRLEAEKALADLQNAQNAKSTVRLQRDQNGNWGYVYTNNSDEVNDLEQAYEDKINDLYSYIMENQARIQDSLFQAWSGMAQSEREIADDILNQISTGQITGDEGVNQLRMALQTAGTYDEKTINSLMAQLSNTFRDLGYVADYFNIAGIFTPMEMIDTFEETALGQIGLTFEDFTENFMNYFTELGNSFINSMKDYTTTVNDISDALGINDGNFGENITRLIGAINQDSIGTLDDIINKDDGVLADLSATMKEQWQAEQEYLERWTREALPKIQKYEAQLNMLVDLLNQLNGNDSFINALTDAQNINDLYLNYDRHVSSSTDGMIEEYLKNNVSYINSIMDSIIGTSMGKIESYSLPTVMDLGETIEQEVHIVAEFPNATNHIEIEEAFNNLNNKAVQYANRKNKGID